MNTTSRRIDSQSGASGALTSLFPNSKSSYRPANGLGLLGNTKSQLSTPKALKYHKVSLASNSRVKIKKTDQRLGLFSGTNVRFRDTRRSAKTC
ncbi:MAG: hypothetical protein LBI81_03470 [Puniceicoccales bacterium]|nr:hypothetical protein [Puniceicoccales bacterium]